MRFFGLPGKGPYTAFSRRLSHSYPQLLANARYQIVPGPRGLPMAQVSLDFQRNVPSVVNPDMGLTVLLDRSGSMGEAFREGHVYNVAQAILTQIASAGSGFHLVFYDDRVSDAGYITTQNDLVNAIRNNQPSGGTEVTGALRHAVNKYQSGKGIYIIVITDGEFNDKAQARDYVINTMLPQVTKDHPYAFRIHFVGAGEGVDHAFLRQIEADASGTGISVVSQHHHAHLSHSHASILDQMDMTLIGIGAHGLVGDAAYFDTDPQPAEHTSPITHVIDPSTGRTWDGPVGKFGFLPRHVTFGCEYSPVHPATQPIGVQFYPHRGDAQNLSVDVPLPRDAATPAGTAMPRKSLFHMPWGHHSPEQDAAKAQAAHDREEMAKLIETNHAAEVQRQATDLRALASGGIPIQAKQRLAEIGSASAEGVLFTSNLDADEAALLRREGFHPLGMVTGSAIYHVGQAYASSTGSCEVKVLSDAYNTATSLAVSRMAQELNLIGAHGVVGVRLSLVRHEWADKTIEVQTVGTAVRGPGPAPQIPWMCDLAGQEWYALHRAGYDSAGLVWGHATWFVLTTAADEQREGSYRNSEIPNFSKGLSHARNIAMTHLTGQAQKLGANGVTGVRIERRLDEVHLTGPGEDPAYEREHHNIVLSIIGTAIRVRPGSSTTTRATTHVLSLRDGRLTPVGMGLGELNVE